MSGEKEVRLREGEYHRLMNTVKQSEVQQQRLQTLDRELAQARQQMQAKQQQTEQRQREFDRTVNKLSQELQATTREYQQNLRGIHQKLDGQRSEYLELIAQQAAHMQHQFDKIARKEQSAKVAAEQWLQDAGHVLDYIATHQRHQQFAPGELQTLQSELNQSQNTAHQGHYQAAIATGQALYGKALKLQAEIEYKQLEWDSHHQLALEGIRKQLAEVDLQQQASWDFTDTESQSSQAIAAEIDYWTDGVLSAFQEQLQQQCAQLENTNEILTIDTLKQYIEQAPEREAELNAIVEQAKARLIASQLRTNIAEDLVEELASAGWQVQDSAWQGEEADGKGWRNSLHIKLKDMGDNEMITIVMPDEPRRGEVENRVQFAYYPHQNNDRHFANDQTRKLNGVLQKLELSDQPLQCVKGHEMTHRADEARRDFAKIKQGSQ